MQKNSRKEQKNKERGITLIALIITVIIMVILAAISINSIYNMAIVEKAIKGSQDYASESVKENKVLDVNLTLKLQVIESRDDTGKLDKNKLISKLTENNAEIKNSDFPLYIIFKGNEYIISENGEIYNLSIENITCLAKINEQLSEMTDSEKLNFYQNFYGRNVNYQPRANIQTSTATANTPKKAQWKIFYADEEHIYLIADSYVSYNSLPSNGDISYRKSDENNLYKSNFNKTQLLTEYAEGTTKINTYAKSNELKALNREFFYWENPLTNQQESLEITSSDGTYYNMRSAASMLDTELWDTKYKDNSGYAEYTIGGPTIEILFASYNQTHNTNYGAKAYKAGEKNSSDVKIADFNGYKISRNVDSDRTSTDWVYYINSMLSSDITKSYNSLYISENNSTNAEKYCVSSPSSKNAGSSYAGCMFVSYNGSIWVGHYEDSSFAFRPIICLKSNVILKQLPEGSDYDFELSF